MDLPLKWGNQQTPFEKNSITYKEQVSTKVKVDNKVEYKANTNHPLFEVLRKVVLKHLGLEDIVETVLERMGNVEEIILVGDYAKGIDSGLIEVF